MTLHMLVEVSGTEKAISHGSPQWGRIMRARRARKWHRAAGRTIMTLGTLVSLILGDIGRILVPATLVTDIAGLAGSTDTSIRVNSVSSGWAQFTAI